jgi:3-(3-hydroxy-phenyl)propionate hydroxylase
VRRAEGVTLREGVEVTGLTHLADGARLELRSRSGEGTVEASAVLGCDGANSTVRGLIGSSMRNLGRPDRWLVLDVRAPGLRLWPGVHQVCDPARAATFMPGPGDRCRWEFRLADGERCDDLLGRVPDLLAPYGVGDAAVERAAEYTFRAEVAERWRHGRVLLAGDAAHLTPPFIGQGLGLGLRDVHQLAWKVADVLSGRADDALLDTHQAERAAHARALIRTAQLLGSLMTRGGRGGAVVRGAVLAGIRRIPAVGPLAATGATPALPPGPLVDRRGRAGRRLAGTLVPQPTVPADGLRCRLDDVLGPDSAELVLLEDDRVRVTTSDATVDVRSPELAGWMRTAGATAVVLRPDRIVRSASGSG